MRRILFPQNENIFMINDLNMLFNIFFDKLKKNNYPKFRIKC